MTKSRKNPFEYGRIEHEKSPIIWIPNYIENLLKAQSQLLEGPRGSGKSSFLHALRYETIWYEKPIITIYGEDSVLKHFNKYSTHLGVYFRFDEINLPYWQNWMNKIDNKEKAQKYFGTFLELKLCYLLIDAVYYIQKNNDKLFKSRNDEIEIVDKLIRMIIYPDSKKRINLIEYSFHALSLQLLDLHSILENQVFCNREIEEIEETAPLIAPGKLLKEFAKLFRKLYRHQADWIIMLLLDDCNLLEEWQTRVLNTAITTVEAPVCFKLSSVTGLYKTKQLIDKNRSLSEDDLQRIELPIQPRSLISTNKRGPIDTNKDFIDFAEHICKLRLEKYYGAEIAKLFNLDHFFGDFDLEQALKLQLTTSLKTEVSNLLKKVDSDDGNYSITKQWLKDNFKDKPNEDDSSKLVARRKDKTLWDKFNHAIAIVMMKEFGIGFPYWGLSIILHLSNGSIRQLLRIMSGIWQQANLEATKFAIQSPLKHDLQLKGVNSAAELYFKSLDEIPLTADGPSLREICNRFGLLFTKFQSRDYLDNPETASLKFDSSLNDELIGIINGGLTAGALLKNEGSDKKVFQIGLDPIMAPYFKIGYRNPFYYSKKITTEQLETIFTGTETEYNRIAKVILDNIKRPKMKLEQFKVTSQTQQNLFDK